MKKIKKASNKLALLLNELVNSSLLNVVYYLPIG